MVTVPITTKLKLSENLKIGLMDFPYGLEECFFYNSTKTFNDFDMVVWNLSSTTFVPYRTRVNSIVNDKIRRTKDFENFFAAGGLLVVLVNGIDRIGLATSPPSSLHTYDLIPHGTKFNVGEGKLIEFKGPEHLKSLWDEQGNNFDYLGVFEDSTPGSFLLQRNARNVVGYEQFIGNGKILCLPQRTFHKDSRVWQGQLGRFIESLEKYHQNSLDTKTEPAPEWISHIKVAGELDAVKEIQKINSEIELLQTQSNAIDEKLKLFQNDKILIYGKSDALAIQVKKAMEELGLKVQFGPAGRDDLIIQYNDLIAVCEVKGTKHSAAERHATQLEKWVLRYHEQNNKFPKGILFVNGYAESELNKRETVYPSQMLPFSTARNHCLLSTVQLLNMLLAYREDKAAGENIIKLIFNTVGVLNDFNSNERITIA